MALFPTDTFRAEIKKLGAQVQFYLNVSFPSGDRYYSSGGLVRSTGVVDGRVLRWSTISRGVPTRGTSLESPSFEVTIADSDHSFSQLLTGSQGHLIQNVACTVSMVLPELDESFGVWQGRLDSWEQPLPLAWTLTIVPEDMPLRREATPKAHLNVGNWPNIHPTAANLRAPIIYGKHSSICVTNEGFLDAVYVDVKRFRYLVGVGKLNAITCVYVDGSPADPATWSIVYPEVDGRVYTALEFTSTLDAATVSVDCEGLTDAGAGGGTLMENPMRCMKNLLHSFVYGDWRQGTWLEDGAAPAPMDTTHYSTLETWFTNKGYRASYRVPCPVSGMEMIASFCESHEIRAFWTNAGEIAFRLEDFDTRDDVYGSLVIRPSEESLFSLGYRGGRLVDRIEGEYVRDEIAGQFAEQLQVRNVGLPIENTGRLPTLERIDLDWSSAFIVDAATTPQYDKAPDTTTEFPGASLEYWYKADAESYNDGDAVGTVTDQSGNGRNLTQATASYKPTYRTERIAGRASYEFDGIDDSLGGSTAWSTLHPASSWTQFIVFKPHAIEAGEEEESGFVGHHIHGPSNQDFEGFHVGAASGGKVVSTTLATVSGVAHATAGVNENDWIIAMAWADSTVELHLRIGRGEVETVAAGARSAGSGNIRWGRLGDEAQKILASQAPPPDSTQDPPVSRYFKGEIIECGGYSVTLNRRQRLQLLEYLEARHTVNPPARIEDARDVLSRRFWMNHRPLGELRVTAPLWAADWEVLDRIWIESPFAPHPDGTGWGNEQWERRPFSIQRSEIDVEAQVVRLTLLDRRPLDATIWDMGWSRLAANRPDSGTPRFYTDVPWSSDRNSKAYHTSPADEDLVVIAYHDQPALSYDGELFERAATNFCLRSSFASGTTGLTLTGTGVNGSAIATDTSELLFDSEITPYCLKFTAGNPHSADLVSTWPATESINIGVYGQYFCVSVDHRDDSGATLYWRLQRSIDSQYWNDGSQTWGGSVDNAITNSTTRVRYRSDVIDIGGSATTLTLAILQQSGGTASRVNRVFHAQVENNRYPTSRMVTDDVKSSRQVTDAGFTQVNSTRHAYSEDRGTFMCEVIPSWSSSNLSASDDRVIYNLVQGAEPEEWHHTLFYDASAGAFVFEVFINGSGTYQATYTQAVTAGTTYKVCSRWTGNIGELGLASYTYSVFVDGTKGTDDQGADPDIGWDTDTLEIGPSWDGVIRRRVLRKHPMTDEEIARFEV
ncbi:MAG: hypothetical protein ACYTAN_13935 [Planctomycetota bacterium]|jgi:hypothetical protein